MSDLLRVDRSPTDCPISAYVAPGQRRGSVPPACGRGPRPGEPVTGCLHVSPAASAPVPPSPAWSGARGTAASVRRGQHLRTRRASAQLGIGAGAAGGRGGQNPAQLVVSILRVGPELCCYKHVRVCRQKWLENRPILEQDSRPRCEVARRLQRRRGPCPLAEVRPGWPHSGSHIR
ncbi:uncharacterized protein LOC118653645 isoform X2 [Myotis myotis]|uniref:uncharacterized protein LOC118653645 isoform X2 n=1 Tax=Myotis myotis TaxID=51298 RepID=UPI0017483D84|nr:uncharacterized protein LOC118653645 isoform X2 [Myotis myotis]